MDDDRLDDRINSYELAARMQLPAPEALDIASQPPHVLWLYALDHGNRRSTSRSTRSSNRLLRPQVPGRPPSAQRGVRFVQIWSGNDNGLPRRNWTSHEDLHRHHGPLALGIARGTAALI